MAAFLSLLAVLTGLGLILAGLMWLAKRVRRRAAGDSVMGPFEEIWHPVAHQARIEIHAQSEQRAPMPSADDR